MGVIYLLLFILINDTLKLDILLYHLSLPSGMDSPNSIMVCRVCLIMNVKMYNITKHNLNIIYEQVTGVKINSEDKLPQELCSECITRLSTSYNFIKNALKTQGLLNDKIIVSGYITLEDIKSINKDHTELIPTNECNIIMTEEVNTDSIKRYENNDESKSKEDLQIEYEPLLDIEKFAKEKYEDFQIKCEPEDNELTIEEVADNSYVFTYTEEDDESNILADTIQRISEQTRPQSRNKIKKKRKRIKSKEAIKCGDCEYTTFYKYLLKLHINSKHTKHGILNCSYCSYTTYYKNHLMLHVNAKHTKDTVYACQYCAFESYRKQYLNSHINAIHTKTTSFSCTHCSYTTYYKRLLNKHVKVKHT